MIITFDFHQISELSEIRNYIVTIFYYKIFTWILKS